jgi:hypothetical protein
LCYSVGATETEPQCARVLVCVGATGTELQCARVLLCEVGSTGTELQCARVLFRWLDWNRTPVCLVTVSCVCVVCSQSALFRSASEPFVRLEQNSSVLVPKIVIPYIIFSLSLYLSHSTSFYFSGYHPPYNHFRLCHWRLNSLPSVVGSIGALFRT